MKFAPRRDERGRVVAPARVLLAAELASKASAVGADGTLVLPRAWLSHARPGMRVRFEDLRGKSRELRVVAPFEASWIAELTQTAYVGPETQLRFVDADDVAPASPVQVPAREHKITLRPGDRLRVMKNVALGGPPDESAPGSAARIGCTLPQIFGRVRDGDRIWFDDGKIGGIVVAAGPEEFEVKITHGNASGTKLGADKGINLPDTDLELPFLSDKDREDLRFVATHADVVGLSFIQRTEDLDDLARELVGIGASGPAIVIKVETRQAFESLPDLLLSAIQRWPVGVMIARGDLAIELGYERLAEVQEEILWISEAAHVPVVWATAVLETLAREGLPTRAEITDAAMSQRAECVMLNKGPHVLEAIQVLDDILQRMDAHQRKKTAFLRPLKVSKAPR
jgi:pyruvate kinase